jgi:hypothetical protein
MKLRAAFLTAVIAALAAAPTATAAPWKRVTAENGSGIDQVGLARTGDGVLHLAWHHPTGQPNSEDLLHTVITRDGRVGATNPIEANWVGFSNPALVVEPGGLRAFWGGFRTFDTDDPLQEIATSLLPDGGAWTLQPTPVNPGGGQSYASPISATVRPDGTTVQAWSGTLGTWAHVGLDAEDASRGIHNFMAKRQYGNNPNLVTDAAGRVWMGWYSNDRAGFGVLAQQVGAGGEPVGSQLTMPGTSAMNIGMGGRTPLVARSGGGVYTAYPTPQAMNQVRVWRVGASDAPIVARKAGSGPVTIAKADDGRLWAIWDDRGGLGATIHARRSNRRATNWGAEVTAGRPRGTLQAYSLDASAIGGAVDVLGVFNLGTTTNAATFHRRLQPGLTLTAAPGRLRSGRSNEVRFTVKDAGDAVSGARVSVGGKSGTTNGRGRVEFDLPGRAVKATATKAGYVKDTLRLKAR